MSEEAVFLIETSVSRENQRAGGGRKIVSKGVEYRWREMIGVREATALVETFCKVMIETERRGLFPKRLSGPMLTISCRTQGMMAE